MPEVQPVSKAFIIISILFSAICWYLAFSLSGDFGYLLWMAPIPVLYCSLFLKKQMGFSYCLYQLPVRTLKLVTIFAKRVACTAGYPVYCFITADICIDRDSSKEDYPSLFTLVCCICFSGVIHLV